jgi:predicted nucleic acid-binding protein
MPGCFLDTSALVKHYHPELGSAELDQLWNDPRNVLVASRLSGVEIISAFAGKGRTGTITASDFDTLTRRFAADIVSKRLTTVRLLVLHLKEADRLLRQYALSLQLRTLDALQLAVALDLKKRGIVNEFVCSDKNLLGVAASEGLAVLNPESP